MVPERSDRPTRDGGTQIVPELRAEADRLRHLSDPKLRHGSNGLDSVVPAGGLNCQA